MLLIVLRVIARALRVWRSGVGAQTQSTSSNTAGHHTMDGKVTKVDAQKGRIDVKTPEGSMKLHFPPAALAREPGA
jgi:hypothetical protein